MGITKCEKNTWGHRRVGHWNWFFNVSFVEFLQKLEFRKKKLYLFDTFSSYKVDEFGKLLLINLNFMQNLLKIQKIFNKFKNIHFVKGDIFQTLSKYKKLKISLLHLDLNYAEAEVYALKSFEKYISEELLF